MLYIYICHRRVQVCNGERKAYLPTIFPIVDKAYFRRMVIRKCQRDIRVRRRIHIRTKNVEIVAINGRVPVFVLPIAYYNLDVQINIIPLREFDDTRCYC
jgi:hypothetical protein